MIVNVGELGVMGVFSHVSDIKDRKVRDRVYLHVDIPRTQNSKKSEDTWQLITRM